MLENTGYNQSLELQHEKKFCFHLNLKSMFRLVCLEKGLGNWCINMIKTWNAFIAIEVYRCNNRFAQPLCFLQTILLRMKWLRILALL